MKLIGNNGETLAEWDPVAGKRNLYCSGGFGLMLTKKAMERCIRADDVETKDLFETAEQPERADEKENFSIFGIKI